MSKGAQQPKHAQRQEFQQEPWLTELADRLAYHFLRSEAKPKREPSNWDDREDLQGYGEEYTPSEKVRLNYQALIDDAFDARWGIHWLWCQEEL